MASTISSRYFARFARLAFVASFVAAGSLVLRGEPVRACGFYAPPVEDFVTFDVDAFGDAPTCADCTSRALLADWRGFLKEAALADDAWRKLLFETPAAELAAQQRAARSPRLRDALAYVALARRIEPHASLQATDDNGTPRRPPPAALLAEAQAARRAAKDPFLAQRYAFQVIRVLFYQRDWKATIAFHDQNARQLAAPSQELAWSARMYLAGALRRAHQEARANVELARIYGSYPAFASTALVDFKIAEQADWERTLRAAADVRERTQLWRMLGDKKDDPLVAAQEIVRLDPKSNLLGSLVLRELARAEGMISTSDEKPEPSRVAARDRAYAVLDRLALRLAETPGADRPWLMQLVLGHIAAKRGDLAGARTHLDKALALNGRDPRVVGQAAASLSLALAHGFKIDPAHENELAQQMLRLDPKFGPRAAVNANVRIVLARAYAKAGNLVEAELLRDGTSPRKWAEAGFIKELIARIGKRASAWDRFVLADGPTAPALQTELAFRYLLDGDIAAARRTLPAPVRNEPLGTDPFVIHVVDCHDCDHEKYGKSAWTTASTLARLDELVGKAAGNGDAAAEAALTIGNALYNVTWYGNARGVLSGTHQETRDTGPALRWYKRAFDAAKSRELKVKAAFLAAKCELGDLVNKAPDQSYDTLPVPRTWFKTVRQFADTRYYKEILRECGHFRAWSATGK